MSALLVASCGGADEGDGTVAADPTGQAGESDGAVPTPGGTLTYGVSGATSSLDPVVSSGGGTSGGTELAAIYDVLMRWNPEAREYEPRTAESLTPNDDFTEWTLKLRPGITFGDGTPYDAEAVKFNIERHRAPTSRSRAKSYLAHVGEVTVVDPLTVRFTLPEPWTGFPYVLSREAGMLVSPTALEKLGEDLSLDPVGAGAGPFEIKSFRPNEGIVMTKKADYWGGEVYLDELRFVFIAGFAEKYEALKADTLQAVFLRDPEINEAAVNDGYGTYTNVVQGAAYFMNMGGQLTCREATPHPACAGQAPGTMVQVTTPGSDPVVRRAIAAAFDPEVFDERVRDGMNWSGTALFQESFPWDPGVPGPEHDLEEAKPLVEQAKAAGWDGKINLTCHNGIPENALAMTTFLQSAGMEVQVKNDYDVQSFIVDYIGRNFDLACSSLNIPPDDGAFVTLDQNLRSSSAGNRVGYASPAMDRALRELKVATDDDAKRDAFGKIAELVSQDLPVLVTATTREVIAWDPKVHDITPTSSAVILFDKTWIEQ